MLTSFLVIDDFYDQPMKVREHVLGFDYPEPETPRNYAGFDSSQRLKVKDMDKIVSRLVGEPLVGLPEIGHNRCRLSLAEHDETRAYRIHVDAGVYWSGILYLSAPEDCHGGTELYRHKETGTDRAPIYEHEMKALGANNYREAAEPIIARDSNDLDKWDLLMTIPMRFNRLILLRPWLWHAAGPSFGTNKENGRLIQLMFFTRAAPQPEAG